MQSTRQGNTLLHRYNIGYLFGRLYPGVGVLGRLHFKFPLDTYLDVTTLFMGLNDIYVEVVQVGSLIMATQIMRHK